MADNQPVVLDALGENSTIVFDTSDGSTVLQAEIPILNLVPETAPILKEVMPEYNFQKQEIGQFKTAADLASSLIETCKKYNGIGLSANQVGIKARVFVMGAGKEFVAFFNPKIVASSTEEVHMVEGCLSFPYLGLYITRPSGVVVDYQDFEGKSHQTNLTGMSARCFLHELDHMNGIVYTEKSKPLALKQALKKRDKINKLIHKTNKNLEKLEKNGNTSRIR